MTSGRWAKQHPRSSSFPTSLSTRGVGADPACVSQKFQEGGVHERCVARVCRRLRAKFAQSCVYFVSSEIPTRKRKIAAFEPGNFPIAPPCPMVALNRSFKSQIVARSAAFGTPSPKSNWPLSFSAPKNHSFFNREVFKVQTQVNRKR